MKGLNVKKSFLFNVDYLNALVSRANSLEELDSKLLYEIAYAEVYCTKMLVQITDPELVKQVSEICSALEVVLSSQDLDDLKESKDYKNLLKLRCKNLDDVTYVEEIMVKPASVVEIYIKTNFKYYLVMFITLGVLASNLSLSSITQKLWGVLLVWGMVDLFFSVICLVSLILSTLYISLSLAYLALPQLRALGLPFEKFIIDTVKSYVIEYDNQAYIYKKIKKYDRVQRDTDWLGAMIKLLYTTGENAKLLSKLQQIKCSLENSNTKKSERYRLLAEIELIHSKLYKK